MVEKKTCARCNWDYGSIREERDSLKKQVEEYVETVAKLRKTNHALYMENCGLKYEKKFLTMKLQAYDEGLIRPCNLK